MVQKYQKTLNINEFKQQTSVCLRYFILQELLKIEFRQIFTYLMLNFGEGSKVVCSVLAESPPVIINSPSGSSKKSW